MIIILQDKKGFRKEQYVSHFPPFYEIEEVPPMQVVMSSRLPDYVPAKRLRFFPEGHAPEKAGGEYIWVYKEMNNG